MQRGKSPTQPETEGLAQASLSLGPLGAQSSLGARRSPPPRPLSPRLWKLQGPPPAPAQSWWDDSPLALRWGLRISLVSRPKLGRRGAETLRPSVAGCHAGSSLEPQHKGPLSCLPHPGRTWQQPGPGGLVAGPPQARSATSLCPQARGWPFSPSQVRPPCPWTACVSCPTPFTLPWQRPHPAGGPGRNLCLAATGFSSDPGTCSCLPLGQDGVLCGVAPG